MTYACLYEVDLESTLMHQFLMNKMFLDYVPSGLRRFPFSFRLFHLFICQKKKREEINFKVSLS